MHLHTDGIFIERQGTTGHTLTLLHHLVFSLSSLVSAFQISGSLNGLGENPHPKGNLTTVVLPHDLYREVSMLTWMLLVACIDLSIKTRVVLSGGEYSAMVTKEGRFTLYVSQHPKYLRMPKHEQCD
jgi:hypothetical protein